MPDSFYVSHGADGDWFVVKPNPISLESEVESLREHRTVIKVTAAPWNGVDRYKAGYVRGPIHEVKVPGRPGRLTRWFLRRRRKTLTDHRDRLVEGIERYGGGDLEPQQVTNWRGDLVEVQERLDYVNGRLNDADS